MLGGDFAAAMFGPIMEKVERAHRHAKEVGDLMVVLLGLSPGWVSSSERKHLSATHAACFPSMLASIKSVLSPQFKEDSFFSGPCGSR
jgi:hypothetical protein